MPTVIPYSQWKAQQGGGTAQGATQSPTATLTTKPGVVPYSQWKAQQAPKPAQPSAFGQAMGAARSVVKGAGDFFRGAEQEVVKPFVNVEKFGIEKVFGKSAAEEAFPQDTLDKMTKLPGESEKPSSSLVSGAGKVVGATAPYLTGIGEIDAALAGAKISASLAGYLSGKFLSYAPKIAGWLASKLPKMAVATAVGTAQSGDIKSGLETGALTGAMETLPMLKKAVAPTLAFTSGVKEGAIKEAQQAPDVIKTGMGMTAEDVRNKAVSTLDGLFKDMRGAFSKGLTDLQKNTPYRAEGRILNTIPQFFKNTLQDVKSGIPSVFRDFSVAVENKGRTLNFDKLNSSVVKSSEQNNLQKALDTINRQTNFSPRGVQAVAARLEALTKYGENNETSAIITKIKNSYDTAIEKHYPELGALRATYGKTAQHLDDIRNIVGSAFDDPTKIQTAVSKLQNIFNEDKEGYLNIIKDLANRSGVNFPALVASDQFKRVLPDFIRGIGGAGVLSASAKMLNPFMFLLLPLFSPRGVGALVTKQGVSTAGTVLGGVTKAIPGLSSQQGQQ